MLLEDGQNRAKETIKISSTMSKTEAQKESVRNSPEYLRCSEEEQIGKKLANVCEFTRHQAASIGEMKTELTLPRSVSRHPIFYRIGEALRSLFVAQMWVESSPNTSQELLKLRATVSRTGEEAQFEAEIAGSKYQIRNIRIPYVLKGVFRCRGSQPQDCLDAKAFVEELADPEVGWPEVVGPG